MPWRKPPAEYSDHALKGDWKGYRDARMEPDWLLIYREDGAHVWLARTTIHFEIFR
ncbi:MAG: type II toxin-antitoxin system YafQ family toxin [Magnetococcales bacterium]|nr:type II toxin-antitoxin system YafQ family toxin [Magnetococcales bacterium]MBF0150891.1 type II toxin-antitoxin system YafQ family toxin [Magnetococcales bacterium]